MKRFRAGRKTAFFAFLALALSLAGQTGAAKQPKIKFKETAFDFGKVKQGVALSHEFVFNNEGEAPLKIRNISTTCGCMAALVSKDTVAPGKEGKISVKFDTRGYGGQVAKQVFVESNDPADPQTMLEVKVDIEVPPSPKIDIEPYNFDIGLEVEGEDIKARMKVMNRGEMELRLEFSHRNASFFLDGKPAPSPLKVAAGKSLELEIRIPAEGRTGMLREYILIKSNDPVRSTLSFYLSGYIVTKQQLRELFVKYKNVLN